jgi:hypothetical protein
VQSVDVLPTVAEILRTGVPWPVAGASALSGTPPTHKIIRTNAGQPLELSAELPRDWPAVARKRELFGELSSWDAVYALGPWRALVGRPLEELGSAPRSSAAASVEGLGRFAAVDPEAELLPAYVEGTLEAGPGAAPPAWLAVAVNGVVRAACASFARAGSSAQFAALVPASSFVAGENALELFEILPDGALAPLPQHTYRVERGPEGAPAAFERGDGARFPIAPGELIGSVASAEIEDQNLRLSGFAFDARQRVPASAILLVIEGAAEPLVASLGHARPALERLGGEESLELSGFRYELPLSLFGGDPARKLRAFALGSGAASELPFGRSARWVQAR